MDQETRSRDKAISWATVYASSSNALHEDYYRHASQVGEILGKAGISIRYGGGGVGLMRAMADSAMSKGGYVHGVIPDFLNTVEHGHKSLPGLDVVSSMAERKQKMLENSDAVVALPGGSGTLEELFEVLTLKRLGKFLGPIVLVNTRGYYDRLSDLLNHIVGERFMAKGHLEMWSIINSPSELLAAFNAAPEWSSDARKFAAVRSS
ncbi:MAG TPA: TIGR00730 family Rossman fold protein [Xanthomonadales bacterium]|nr:TIGR00730 family Rossman fold protein [Xanthomonadales bacterium]